MTWLPFGKLEVILALCLWVDNYSTSKEWIMMIDWSADSMGQSLTATFDHDYTSKNWLLHYWSHDFLWARVQSVFPAGIFTYYRWTSAFSTNMFLRDFYFPLSCDSKPNCHIGLHHNKNVVGKKLSIIYWWCRSTLECRKSNKKFITIEKYPTSGHVSNVSKPDSGLCWYCKVWHRVLSELYGSLDTHVDKTSVPLWMPDLGAFWCTKE